MTDDYFEILIVKKVGRQKGSKEEGECVTELPHYELSIIFLISCFHIPFLSNYRVVVREQREGYPWTTPCRLNYT